MVLSPLGLSSPQETQARKAPTPNAVLNQLDSIPAPTIALAAFALGGVTTYFSTAAYRRFFKRIPNAEWMTPNHLHGRRWIKGRVTSVGDADGFRLYHTPAFGWRWPLKFRRVPEDAKHLKGETISMRLAGVDAPEGGHFGGTEQPYYKESKQWLEKRVLGKTIYCQLIKRDMYMRVLVMPHLKPSFLPGSLFKGENVAIQMLREGWAVTYEQRGAEYGSYTVEQLQQIQAEAKSARRGIWESGRRIEMPAEYKRKLAAGQAWAADKGTGEVSTEDLSGESERPKGFLRRLLTRK